jgi:hypothetical protein
MLAKEVLLALEITEGELEEVVHSYAILTI